LFAGLIHWIKIY